MRIVVRTENIKALMARQNMTQREIAGSLSVTSVHLCNIVKGKAPVSPRIREKILSLFPGRRWETIFRIED